MGVKKGAPHFETSPYTTEVFTGLGEGLKDWIRLDFIYIYGFGVVTGLLKIDVFEGVAQGH